MKKNPVIKKQPKQMHPKAQKLSLEQLKAVKGGANPWLDAPQDD